MSALTKIAIVLLVVASLLLSAGVVVFVNKVEDFKQTADASKEMLSKEQNISRVLKTDLETLRVQSQTAANEYNRNIDDVRKESAAKDPVIADLKGQITKLEADKKNVEVALAAMTKVQEGQQTQLAASLAQVTELRGIRDKLVEERHSLNVQLTDALSKLDTVTRAYQNAQERLQGKTAALDKLERDLADRGINLSTIAKRTNEGTPYLEGVVNGVFSAGGKQWASVSIGSKDNVEKGMKFNVVNNNEFLGYLTIQTTEPNDAAGVLEGPKVEKVRQGDQVKTQLQ